MTPEEAVRLLDEIPAGDPEAAHTDADDVLLDLVPAEVRDAYNRVIHRQSWWATA